MAFGRLDRAPLARPMSDINMTPLVDVMLVLLVIFIVAAPLLGSSLHLDLPEARGSPDAGDPAALLVSLDAAGQVYLADRPIDSGALQTALVAAAARDPSVEVRLRADRTVPYGRVAELIAALQAAGLSRVAFVTELPPAR